MSCERTHKGENDNVKICPLRFCKSTKIKLHVQLYVQLNKGLVSFQDNIVEGEVHVDPKHHKYFVAKRGEKLREIADDFGGVVVSFPRNGINSDRVVLKGAKDCIEGAKKRILEIVDELDSMVSIDCVIPQKYHRNIMGAKGVNVQKVTSQHRVQIKFPDRDPGTRGQGMVNGSSSPVEVNGDDAGSPPASPRKCDTITITGSKDNAEAAKEALLVSETSVSVVDLGGGLGGRETDCFLLLV